MTHAVVSDLAAERCLLLLEELDRESGGAAAGRCEADQFRPPVSRVGNVLDVAELGRLGDHLGDGLAGDARTARQVGGTHAVGTQLAKNRHLTGPQSLEPSRMGPGEHLRLEGLERLFEQHSEFEVLSGHGDQDTQGA